MASCSYFANGTYVCNHHMTTKQSREHFKVQTPEISSLAYQCALYANGRPVKRLYKGKKMRNILADSETLLKFDVRCQQVGTCPVAPSIPIPEKDCHDSCRQQYRGASSNGKLGNMCSCNLPGLRDCAPPPGYA